VSGSGRKPGSLGPFVDGYRAWLVGRGYSPSVVVWSLVTLGHLGRRLEGNALAVDPLTDEAVTARRVFGVILGVLALIAGVLVIVRPGARRLSERSDVGGRFAEFRLPANHRAAGRPAQALVAEPAHRRAGRVRQPGQGALEDRGQDRRLGRGELGDDGREDLVPDVEDLPRLAPAGSGDVKRDRRSPSRRAPADEPLLDEPVDDPDGGGMREADRLPEELHRAAGEVRDRDQRSGGRSRVTNDVLRLDSNPVGDREGEGAEQVL
jgi:hypothetical protein